MEKSYENLKRIITSMQYDELNWHICADFKVVAMLTGLQLGYFNFYYFLCLCNSRARAEHHICKDWSIRDEVKQGKHNIMHKALAKSDIISLPPLHTKGTLIQI